MAYSFTSKEIFDALQKASERGVDVKIVLDKSQETDQYSVFRFAKHSPTIQVRIDRKTTGIFHHKVILIDEDIVIVGSYNFSNDAEYRNAENINLLKDKHIYDRYNEEFERFFFQ